MRKLSAELTSGSGIFRDSMGISSLKGTIILFGNTTMAAICSTIVFLKISLKEASRFCLHFYIRLAIILISYYVRVKNL